MLLIASEDNIALLTASEDNIVLLVAIKGNDLDSFSIQ